MPSLILRLIELFSDGLISHDEDSRRLSFSGIYGEGPALFNLTQRCTLSDEPNTFTLGDVWVGSYRCSSRELSDVVPTEGKLDIRRMSLEISRVEMGMVTAFVTIDHDFGVSQYETTALFNDQSLCAAVEFSPTAAAWQTSYPEGVSALTLSGRVSEDRGSLFGQLNLNQNCRCLGIDVEGKGSSCRDWDQNDEKWCYVDRSWYVMQMPLFLFSIR